MKVYLTSEQSYSLKYPICRSRYHRCSIKIGILKDFVKLTGKQQCWSLFLNKVVGLRPRALLKIESPTEELFCEFGEI